MSRFFAFASGCKGKEVMRRGRLERKVKKGRGRTPLSPGYMEPVWDMRTKQRTTRPRSKSTRSKRRTTATPESRGIWPAYEWFLELPVAVVLSVIWVAGVVLLGACVLLTYAGISALARMVAGAF